MNANQISLEKIRFTYPEMEIGIGLWGYVIHNFDELPFNVAFGMTEEQFIKYVLDKM